MSEVCRLSIMSDVIQYNNNTFKTGFLDIFMLTNVFVTIRPNHGITSVHKQFLEFGVCNQIGFNHFLNK